MAKLGIARSLVRRFARLDEVETIWRPIAQAPAGAGVFGHIKPKQATAEPQVALPATTLTWEKFVRTILPTAERIELQAPPHGRYLAMVTAEHADAPPILKWDRAERRNPVSWYVHPHGSPAISWGLVSGWVEALGVTPFPNLWGDQPMPHLATGAILVLKGAEDTDRTGGNALFPELLKDELHGVRSTVERYSRTAMIGGRNTGQQLASGYDIRKESADCTLRVTAGGHAAVYQIDRWD